MDFTQHVVAEIVKLRNTAKGTRDVPVLCACDDILDMSYIISGNVSHEDDVRPVQERYQDRLHAVLAYNAKNERLGAVNRKAYSHILQALSIQLRVTI